MAVTARVEALITAKNDMGRGLASAAKALEDFRKRSSRISTMAPDHLAERWARAKTRQDQAQRALAATSRRDGFMGESGVGGMAMAGAAMRIGGPAAAVAGIGYALHSGAQKGLSFERVMYDVQRATDRSGESLERTQREIEGMAKATGKSREELARIYAAAGFAGRPIEELGQFTDYAAKAMTAWGTNAESTGQALAEIGNIYRAKQARIQEIGDAINSVADASASKETDLLEFLRRTGSTSNMVQMTAEQTMAFGAALKEIGVQSEVAATGFNAMLTKMAQLGDEDDKVLGQLGLSAKKLKAAFQQDATKAIMTFLQAVGNLPGGAQKIAALTDLFGKEYADDIARMSGATQRLASLLQLVGDKAKYVGSVQKGFELVKEKDFNKLDRAAQAIEIFHARVGSTLKQNYGAFAEWGIGALEWIEKVGKGIEEIGSSPKHPFHIPARGEIKKQVDSKLEAGLRQEIADLEAEIAKLDPQSRRAEIGRTRLSRARKALAEINTTNPPDMPPLPPEPPDVVKQFKELAAQPAHPPVQGVEQNKPVKGPPAPIARPAGLGDGSLFPVQPLDEVKKKADEVKAKVGEIGPAGAQGAAQLSGAFAQEMTKIEAQAETTASRIQAIFSRIRMPSLNFGRGQGGLNTGPSMGELGAP